MKRAHLLPFPRRDPVSEERAAADNLRQLVQLRWLAVAGQLATILLVHYGLGAPLPLLPMLALVAALAAMNLFSLSRLRAHPGNFQLFASLMFDVGILTGQLYLSGGASNPFVGLYLLQVVLGAILLETWSAWALVALTAICFASLAVSYAPLRFPGLASDRVAGLFVLGSWLCFLLVATLLVFFIGRIGRIIRARDAHVADLRRRAAEEDGIVRMGLLASGAAHELGTPLAQLSVILGDWKRVPQLRADPALSEELAEMQAAVARCKAIVTDVLQSAGEPRGVAPEPTTALGFLQSVADEWRAAHPGEPLFLDLQLDGGQAIIADPALRQSVWNLLDNARDASPGQITLAARAEQGELRVTVIDRGDGFSPDMLDRLGRPGVTSKGPGHGVGLFLVTNVVRKLGGRVEAANRAGRGAQVTITLPLATIGASEASLKWTRTARSSS